MPETTSVDQVFTEMESKFRADKAAGVNATFQFNITGDQGGVWNAVINDGNANLSKGEVDSPDVTITSSADDWVNIANGSLNPQMAFMTGKLKVQGNLGLATRLQQLFF